MARPIVTCGAKIVLAWNASSGVYDASLSASATGTPDQWEWTILSVPTGLEALLSGTWGDFTDGMALLQNPALDNIPTDTVAGTIVARCRAHNADGWSNPAEDRAGGQQPIVIKSELADLEIPGDLQYDWGEGQLNLALRKLDAVVGAVGSIATKPLLYRSPKLVNLGTITASKAAGSVTVVAKASLSDGDEVAIPDGDNPIVHFIFDVSGTYTPGGGYDATHVRVDVSSVTTAEEVRNALWSAVYLSREAGDLNVIATQGASVDVVDLENESSGTFGNLPITETGPCTVVGMTGGAGDIVVLSVAGGETPSETAAVGSVTTVGAVVAQNTSFGAPSLAVVTGKNVIMPANMVLIRDSATDDPILWEGKTVYGLLHCESAVDGHSFNDTDRQVAITFVREIDSTTHALGYVKGEAVSGRALNYSYVVRTTLSALSEAAHLDGGFTDGAGGEWAMVSIGSGEYRASVGELIMVDHESVTTIRFPPVVAGRISIKSMGMSSIDVVSSDGSTSIWWRSSSGSSSVAVYGQAEAVEFVGDPTRSRWVGITDMHVHG